MPTIYELSNEYKQLLEMLSEPDYTEYEEAIRETLCIKGEELELKADNYVKLWKQLEYDAEAAKKEAERLSERAKAKINNANRLKRVLEDIMISTGKRKFQTLLFSYRIQNNPPKLIIENESRIPKEYYVPQDPRLDKEGIKKDILSGKEVEGATVIQTQGIRVG